MKRYFEAALLVALVVFVAAPAWPQAGVTLGTIEGTARDSTGGVLTGAAVTIRNIETG